MPSIVKVPRYSVYDDYDFIGFSFNGYHCVEDLGIIRVGNGTRYQENLTPQIQDQIGQHPGMDGAYFIGAQHRQKTFDIQIAFDNLTQDQIWKLHEVFSGDDIHDLWFDEYPYKVWDAKITGQPQLQVIPFDDDTGGILYKGEGTVQFTAYYPYAHTPDYVQWEEGETETEWKTRDGRLFSSYTPFNNKEQWKDAANLWETIPELPKIDVRGEIGTYLSGKYQNTETQIMEKDLGTASFHLNDTWNFELSFTITKECLNEIKEIALRSIVPEEWDYITIGPLLYSNGTWLESESESTGGGYNYSYNIIYQDESEIQYQFSNYPTDYGFWIELLTTNKVEVDIDLPDPDFAYSLKIPSTTTTILKPLEIKLNNKIIYQVVLSDTNEDGYEFNCKTGLVKNSETKKAAKYTGKIFGALEPDEEYTISAGEVKELNYHFWFY